jgi:hypothetical protein
MAETTQFIIEDGVPIPGKKAKHKSPLRITMEKMVVGQSTLIPETDMRKFGSIRGYLKPKRFVTRREGDFSFRVWRIEDARD